MKKYLLSLVCILILTGCSFNTLQFSQAKPKEEQLLLQANKGDLNSMILLDKYYNFPVYSRGLTYYEMWYETINKSKNLDAICKLSKIYSKNESKFINGKEKVRTLYEKCYKHNFTLAAMPLFELYKKQRKKEKAQQIKLEIIESKNSEIIEQLYVYFLNKYNSTETKELFNVIKKYNIKLSSETQLLELNKFSYKVPTPLHKVYKEKIDFILKENNPLKLEILAKHYEKIRSYKKALDIYELLNKLKPNDKDIYFSIAKMYRYLKLKDHVVYFEKAYSLGSLKAAEELLKSYSFNNTRDVDKFQQLKTDLLRYKEGKYILLNFYQRFNKHEYYVNLADELATDGDKHLIIELANSNIKYDMNILYIINKWKKYIQNSNDKKLLELMDEKALLNINQSTYKDIVEKEIELGNLDFINKKVKSKAWNSPNIAIKYAQKAILAGDVGTTKKIVDIYLKSRKKDFKKAVELLEALMERGDDKSRLQLAEFYLNPPNALIKYQNTNKALELFKKEIAENDIVVMERIINHFSSSKYKDYKKAFYYTKKILENPNLSQSKKSLQYARLGYFIQFAESTPSSNELKQAKKYYEKAISLGYNSAEGYLASLYARLGYFIQFAESTPSLNELKQAKKYYEKAISLGFSFGDIYLAALYIDFSKLSKYRKISFNNYPNRLIEEDNKKAFYYLKRGLKKDKRIFIYTGLFYEYVKKDINKAIEYYKKSFYRKEEAAYHLGLIYHYGKQGVKKDLKLAKKWYLKASDIKEAKEQLKLTKDK